ncbi:C40 family peptidase [Levilactobacillus namurensis]|uniref:LysM peptidoglycan-binding domain-containing protein n=1 Tax=Levilactobacillus namurensis TaxID=380393 RepID=A0AAW8W791_9LACO|nr:LysM peptidoglycan-binding domain-containing protein [Levilactobacillus namurensis]MDT7014745.1 LysM peptidoglycan-binding domain-containing protein [Levilactobacillus namurensis]
MSTSQRKTKVAVGVVGALGALAAGAQLTASANSIQVQAGDTVWGLSQKYGVSIQTLEEQNSLDTNTDLIFIGQRLQVTKNNQKTYTIKSGDTLWDLAQHYHTTVAALQKANHLTGAMLSVGQKLTIPTTGDVTGTQAESVAPVISQKITKQASAFQAQILAQQQAAASQQQQRQSSASTNSAATQSTTTTGQSATATTSAAASASSSSTVAKTYQHAESATPTSRAQTTTAQRQSTSQQQTTPKADQSSQSSSVTSAQSATTTTTSSAATSQAAAKAPSTSQSSSSTQSQSQAVTTTRQSTVKTKQSSTQSQASQATQTSQTPVTRATTTKTVKRAPKAVKTPRRAKISAYRASVSSSTTSRVSQSQQQATATSSSSTASATSSSATSTVSQSKKATTPTTAASASSTTTKKNTAGLTSGSVTGLALKLASANIPYVWGGSSLSGMDCSGFVAYVYQHASGISLPHSTVAQESRVTTHSVASAQPGDLLFWGSKGATYHDAIYLGNGEFVAAPAPGQNVSVQTISKYFMPSFAGTLK